MELDTFVRNAKYVRDHLLDESERIIYANEREIIRLNIIKIEQGEGSDDNPLKNDNKIFTGYYSLTTQLLNPKKVAGTLYDFFDTGEFLGNFQVEVSSDLTKIEIFSTGTGSGEKAGFFRGYRNLYGLDPEDQIKLNYEIILPKLQEFAHKHI